MSHYQEHHENHSHAHFDEREDSNPYHVQKPRFSGAGYSNKRFSAEGYSNERFNVDALNEEDELDDEYIDEIPDVDDSEDFLDDNFPYSQKLRQTPSYSSIDHPGDLSNEAPYGHAFSNEGANKYFAQPQFLHYDTDEVAHERPYSHRPSISPHKHRTFSAVIPSKTLFGQAFSHSFGEIPNKFQHGNEAKSYSQNEVFHEDDQISNDYSQVQICFSNNNIMIPDYTPRNPDPDPLGILHETMSTQTVETKKPQKLSSMMQKCRIISDVTKNYFGECCLNRKQNRYQHEVPTRDYGFIPPSRSMSMEPLISDYLNSLENKGKSPSSVTLRRGFPKLHSSSIPMSVNEIQNRQNLLRMYGRPPPAMEVHCYNPVQEHHMLEGINEEDEKIFCTNEFPEVNACHNINNFNDQYPDPNGSLDSARSFSSCVGPGGPIQRKGLKSCQCKEPRNESPYVYQSRGNLRGGGLDGNNVKRKKVRLNLCTNKRPVSISEVDENMQNYLNERQSTGGENSLRSSSKLCACGSDTNVNSRDHGSAKQEFQNERSTGNENSRRGILKLCACGTYTNVNSRGRDSEKQKFQKERSTGNENSRHGSVKLCACGSDTNANSHGYGSAKQVFHNERSTGNENSRHGSAKLCACGSDTNVNSRDHGSAKQEYENEKSTINENCDHGLPSQEFRNERSTSNEDSRRGSLKSCEYGSNISVNGSIEAYEKAYNLASKQTNCNLGDSNDPKSESIGSGGKRLEMQTNSCCPCRNNQGVKQQDQNNSCNLCCCGKGKTDLHCRCKEKKTKPGGLKLQPCKNLSSESSERSRSHGNLYCRCTSKNPPAPSCCYKNDINEKTKSHGDLLYRWCAEKIKSKPSACGCCCQKSSLKRSNSKIPESQPQNSNSKFSFCSSKTSISESNPSDLIPNLCCSCKKKEELKPLEMKTPASPYSCNPKSSFKIEFNDVNCANQIPTIRVCLCTDPDAKNDSKTKSSLADSEDLTKLKTTLIEPIPNNASTLTDTDDINYEYQNKINSSLIGSSEGVRRLTKSDYNSYKNSVHTSTNYLAKDKSLQAVSRKDEEKLSLEDEGNLPIVFCNHKCKLFNHNLYEGPFEVHNCNPFYVPPYEPLPESQLRVRCNGSDVNVLYTSNIFSKDCNQTTVIQDCYSTNSNSACRVEKISMGSESSFTSDSETFNEINVPVLQDQEIQFAQAKHKTKINTVKRKNTNEEEIKLSTVGKKFKEQSCGCGPSRTANLPPSLEKIKPKNEIFKKENREEEEEKPRSVNCKGGKFKCKCNSNGTDSSEEEERETKYKYFRENSDEVFQEVRKRGKEEKIRTKYVVKNSNGEMQLTAGGSRKKPRRCSSAELYCAFLKRAEVLFLACSMIFYVFIYKILTSYALY